MPHDNNGRIYIDTQTGKGIDVRGDIAYVLGRSTGDVGQLCGDVDANGTRLIPSKINKEAKFKPVVYPSWSATKATVPTLYRGSDGKCGIEIPVLTATEFALSTIQSLIENAADYALLPPTGGPNSPYRVLDFDGYDSQASLLFQFVPPAVRDAGKISLYGDHTFTLRMGNLYTLERTVSANVISLVDLMMRWAENGTLYAYDGGNSYSSNNGIMKNTSYGFLGILCIYRSRIDNAVQVVLNSISLLTTTAPNEITIDFSKIYDESSAPQPREGDSVFLAPCFTNLNTGNTWKALISGTSFPLVKCGLFPKVESGSTSVDYVSYQLYKPIPILAVLSYSIYGATLVSGNTYKATSATGFAGITVTAETGIIGENNQYRITNVNNDYPGAVNNTLIGNITFNNSYQASFTVNFQSEGKSIFIADYIPIQIQIVSPDGEYQNDTIEIRSANYPT